MTSKAHPVARFLFVLAIPVALSAAMWTTSAHTDWAGWWRLMAIVVPIGAAGLLLGDWLRRRRANRPAVPEDLVLRYKR
jgi:hypothetical protein